MTHTYNDMEGQTSVRRVEIMPTIDDICSYLCTDKQRLVLLSKDAKHELVTGPAPLDKSSEGHVTFMGKRHVDTFNKIRPTLLILDETLKIDYDELAHSGVRAVILSAAPRYDFIRVVAQYFSPKRPTGIHPTVVLAKSAIIGSEVFVGPYCVIGEKSCVGDGSTIHSGVHIYDNVRIGRNVIIHSGTVIGTDGFGFHRSPTGEMVKFPHVGGVIIEDDAEIGANTCIDRGTLGDTVVGKGAKIDNLVHIAHNVVIGENSAVIAHAMIGGSAIVGARSWIAPCASVMDGIEIGAGAFIGLGAVVLKSLPANVVAVGNPARILRSVQHGSDTDSGNSAGDEKK